MRQQNCQNTKNAIITEQCMKFSIRDKQKKVDRSATVLIDSKIFKALKKQKQSKHYRRFQTSRT